MFNIYRRLELESEGIQLKLFHPIGTRSPEQLELEEQLRRQEELEKLKQRDIQREERQEKLILPSKSHSPI